ncbi:MAG: ribosome maturation factor RimP [bacterium]
MQRAADSLANLIRGVVEPMGYELLGAEFGTGEGRSQLLRVYIDKESGILLEDCEAVSRQLGSVLDVEDPISGDYSLEISSPGMDRPLFEPEHFEQFLGEMAKIKLSRSLVGRRSYKGYIRGVEDGNVLIEVDNEVHHLAIDDIDTARLVPQFGT